MKNLLPKLALLWLLVAPALSPRDAEMARIVEQAAADLGATSVKP